MSVSERLSVIGKEEKRYSRKVDQRNVQSDETLDVLKVTLKPPHSSQLSQPRPRNRLHENRCDNIGQTTCRKTFKDVKCTLLFSEL